MRVLVCGSRDFGNPEFLNSTLNEFHSKHGIDVLINGAAPGADTLAHLWAQDNGIDTESYPANWKAHGRAAGPMRNKRMLTEGKPDAVIAFINKPLEQSRGTANMCKIAREAGVKVYVEGTIL